MVYQPQPSTPKPTPLSNCKQEQNITVSIPPGNSTSWLSLLIENVSFNLPQNGDICFVLIWVLLWLYWLTLDEIIMVYHDNNNHNVKQIYDDLITKAVSISPLRVSSLPSLVTRYTVRTISFGKHFAFSVDGSKYQLFVYRAVPWLVPGYVLKLCVWNQAPRILYGWTSYSQSFVGEK